MCIRSVFLGAGQISQSHIGMVAPEPGIEQVAMAAPFSETARDQCRSDLRQVDEIAQDWRQFQDPEPSER